MRWLVIHAIRLLIVLTCLTSVASGQSVLIDDFSGAADSRWRFFADTVMGGVSSGDATFASEGSVPFMRLRGNVSTENNGSFIQARRNLTQRLSADTIGFRIRVRGNGNRYFVHLRTSGTILPWQYYQASFATSSDWQEVTLPLTAFEPSGSMMRSTPSATSIRSIAIVAFGKDYQAQVDVAQVTAY